MSDPQALEIQAARGRKAIVEAIVARGEAENPNFYTEWDAAVGKEKGDVHSRSETLPAGEYSHLKPGDHVFYRGAFGIELAEHHGLYVGGGWIVEAWINSSVDGYQRALLTPEIRAGMVDARTLSEFNDGGAKVVFIREYIPHRTPEQRKEAVHRAIESFGTRGYNLMRANCEHFVCEVVAGPGPADERGFLGLISGVNSGITGAGTVPKSSQIDRFVDKPVVLGKICEEYVKDLISKRDALVYIADAEAYLRMAKQREALNESDLGILRSIALRYGYSSTSDGTPIHRAGQQQLLEMLRPAMLINMGRAAPQIAGKVMQGLHHMTAMDTDEEEEPEQKRAAKRARI